ncbi:hypothetical protein M3Y97_00579800 [Aphelenchoides bicaudatus]|nr:hypothetical protein M3Y97_00579800 [Aphelenchoides bicaudatus]
MDSWIRWTVFICFVECFFGQKLHCPRFVPHFSTDPCVPDSNTGRCPTGYRCRPARDQNNTNNVYYICCAQTEMNIGDYFMESELSPKAVPLVPLSLLQKMVFLDRTTNQRIQVPCIDSEVSGVDRIENDTSSYSQLETVEFRFPLDISAGQFLHFIVSQQPLAKPSSIHFYYDYPSFGTATVNLTEMDQRLRRGYVEFISNETIPKKEFYRNQILVLAFRTDTQLLTTEILPRNMDSQINQLLQNASGDLSKFLSSQLISERLGVPIGGTYFWLTSRGTIFKVQEQVIVDSACADLKCNLNTLFVTTVTLLILNNFV